MQGETTDESPAPRSRESKASTEQPVRGESCDEVCSKLIMSPSAGNLVTSILDFETPPAASAGGYA